MKVPKHLMNKILKLPYEIWKCIKGFENYQVSNYGRIKSLNYRQTGKSGILSSALDKRDGYLRVNLCKDGKKYPKLVHQLVSLAFIPNSNNLPCVNHKDEVKTNNNVNNLEWCNHKYNNNYGTHN